MAGDQLLSEDLRRTAGSLKAVTIEDLELLQKS